MNRHVVLVGPMGAGKSAVGAELARRLAAPFVDGDAALEAAAGRNAADVARAEGVAALHRREAATLHAALAGNEPTVIAAAASVVDDPACRRALAAGPFVVWLDAPDAKLAARLGGQAHRRLLGADPAAALATLRARRDTGYRAVASLRLSTDGATVATTVDAIEAALR